MNYNPQKKQILINNLDPALYAAIKAAAEKEERPVSNYLRRLLANFFLPTEQKP